MDIPPAERLCRNLAAAAAAALSTYVVAGWSDLGGRHLVLVVAAVACWVIVLGQAIADRAGTDRA